MSKYSYLNLNQKMIKIRKKIPALIRKRYSEEVDYDFVKLDDINQFLTPALNRYGVDFDILREIPTQISPSGAPVFLTLDGNLWRYEADLEICWTNADHPEEKISSVLHLVGTNDVADKAKGTAMTYGLKYYLLNKFSIPQNGNEDPDMKERKPAPGQQEKPASGEKKESKRKGSEENPMQDTGFVPAEGLEEGLKAKSGCMEKQNTVEKPARNGNVVTSCKAEKAEQQLSFLEESEEPVSSNITAQETFPDSLREAVRQGKENSEEEIDFSEEDEYGKMENITDKGTEGGFRPVAEEDDVPFSDQEQADETMEDEVEKAKAVVCNFGLYKGQTLGEMLETPKGWESLKWIAGRYAGTNREMKDAAKTLVDAGVGIPKAA